MKWPRTSGERKIQFFIQESVLFAKEVLILCIHKVLKWHIGIGKICKCPHLVFYRYRKFRKWFFFWHSVYLESFYRNCILIFKDLPNQQNIGYINLKNVFKIIWYYSKFVNHLHWCLIFMFSSKYCGDWWALIMHGHQLLENTYS